VLDTLIINPVGLFELTVKSNNFSVLPEPIVSDVLELPHDISPIDITVPENVADADVAQLTGYETDIIIIDTKDIILHSNIL
jgi:hypothetical protein